jgi:hypothetical protein
VSITTWVWGLRVRIRCLNAVDTGHIDIHQDDIWRIFFRRCYRLFSIFRQTDDVDVRLPIKKCPQAIADDRMVIGNEHSNEFRQEVSPFLPAGVGQTASFLFRPELLH